jgi:anti-anti-sigma factor
MRLESQIHDGVCVLRLKGRFVTGSDTEFVSARNHLQEAGIAKAVVDLSAVPYIDSTGLAFVVDLHKSLASRGGQLFLAAANARVREVLEITRIGEIVPLFNNVDEAEAALRGEGSNKRVLSARRGQPHRGICSEPDEEGRRPRRSQALDDAATGILPIRVSLIDQDSKACGLHARVNGSELRCNHR